MLEISGICKSYRRQVILEGVELTVEPGDCVGIVGYNGCGKTTLLSIISGALKADKGSIVCNGRQAVGRPAFVVQGKQVGNGRGSEKRSRRHAGGG